MKVSTIFAAGALAALVARPAVAQEKPIQIALFTPVQIVPENQGVSVIRLNFLYSVNRSVRYVDLGFVNVTSGGPSQGIQWAFVAMNKGPFTGWQSAAAAITQGHFEGLQTGWFTSANEGRGLQWGLINTAKKWNGLQLGVVNYTQRLHGVQVGLINVIQTGGQFPVFPIVNWSF